jgi:hypothetical protein
MNYIAKLEKERYNDFLVGMGMALMFGETNKAKDELRKVVHNLQIDNIINPIEAENYMKMIDSEDDENFILANILNNSKNQLKMAITFTADTHKYESNDKANINWTSVTSFVGLFKPAFDKDSVAEKASKNKKSKWYGKTPQEIKDIWKAETDRAIKLGSWYH